MQKYLILILSLLTYSLLAEENEPLNSKVQSKNLDNQDNLADFLDDLNFPWNIVDQYNEEDHIETFKNIKEDARELKSQMCERGNPKCNTSGQKEQAKRLPDPNLLWRQISADWQEWSWVKKQFDFNSADENQDKHIYDDDYSYQGSWTDFFPYDKPITKNWMESDHSESGISGWWHDQLDHQRRDVNLTTDWIGKEDTDFWEYFWVFYWEFAEAWRHEKEAEEIDPEKVYSWFQRASEGIELDHKKLIIDYDDSEQFNWARWDWFWSKYVDSYNIPKELQSSIIKIKGDEIKAADEDFLCEPGFFKADSSLCLKCPAGCRNCHKANQCFECQDNFERVSGPGFQYCFPRCFYGQYRDLEYTELKDFTSQFNFSQAAPEGSNLKPLPDYYIRKAYPPHSMLNTCKPCPDNCRDCRFTEFGVEPECFACQKGFKFDSWMRCVEDPYFNITDSDIMILAGNQEIQRCDDTRLEVIRIQNKHKPLEHVKWSVEVDGDSMTTEVQTLIQRIETYFEGKQKFLLPRNFTEMLTDGGKVKVTVQCTDREGTVHTDEEIIVVNKSPRALLTGFQDNEHYVSHDSDIKYDFEEHWPRCPNQDKYTPIPQTQLKCYLLNRDSLEGELLPDCSIKKEQLRPGWTYGLEFTWTPPDGQNTQTEIIKLQTAQDKVYCHFEGGVLLLADITEPHELAPVIYGDHSLGQKGSPVHQYKWICKQDRKDDCEGDAAVPDEFSDSSSLTIPANAWFQGHIYTYHLLMQNTEQNIDSCTASFAFPNKYEGRQVVEMEIFSTVAHHGWLDWQQDHTFSCQPRHQKDKDLASELKYELSIADLTAWTDRTKKINDKNIIRSKTNPLVAPASFFSPDHEYEVKCMVGSKTKPLVGGIKTRYDTEDLDEEFMFTVMPVQDEDFNSTQSDSNGMINHATGEVVTTDWQKNVPYQTVFKMTVLKPVSEVLQCEFGYFNSIGKVAVEDSSNHASYLSNTVQQVLTTLPQPEGGLNTIEVYAKCTDALGRYLIKYETVPMSKLSLQNSASQISPMEKAKSWFKKDNAKVSDIVNYAVLLGQTEKLYSVEQQTGYIKNLAEAINNRAGPSMEDLTPEDTAQLGTVLNGMTKHLTTMERVDQTLTLQSLSAVQSVIQNGRQTQRDGEHIGVSAISEKTFSALASSVDNLIDVNDKHGSGDAKSGHKVINTQMALFDHGIDRLQGSMSDDRSTDKKYQWGKLFGFDNFNIVIQKFKPLDLAKKGKTGLKVPVPADVSYETDDRRMLQKSKKEYVLMSMPLESELMKQDNVVVSTMYSRETFHNDTLQDMIGDDLRNYFAEVTRLNEGGDDFRQVFRSRSRRGDLSLKYLSGHLMLDTRGTNQGEGDLSNEFYVKDIEVKDLQDSYVVIGFPYVEPEKTQEENLNEVDFKDENGNMRSVQKPFKSVECMELDQQTNKWNAIRKCDADQITTKNKLPPNYVFCCSDRLTMFALMEVTQTFEPAPENSYLTRLVIYNLVALGLYFTGVFLDKAFKKSQEKEKIELEGKKVSSPRIDDSQRASQVIGDRSSVLGLCNPSPIRGMDKNSPDFDKVANAADQASNSSLGIANATPDQVDPANAKVQLDDIKIDIEQSDHRIQSMSASSFNPTMELERVPTKLGFCRVYCNALKYYHRLFSIFIGCPAPESWSRSGKAIIFSTQAFLCIAIVGLWYAFEVEEWGAIVFTIVAMRLVQLAFGFVKPIGKSKMIVATSALAVGAIYGICNVIAYIAMRDDFRPRNLAGTCLLIEFVVWETLLMPLVISIACMINPRVANYMKALQIDPKNGNNQMN